MAEYVSRAGRKLEHALGTFGINVTGLTCADLGSNVGGFVDYLLKHGAAKVYAIEKGYGVLEWKLRKDPRVVVMERTNAMHVVLPEKVSLVSIDVAWTRQRNILPKARELLREGGRIITLIKPHYEADKSLLRKGILQPEHLDDVIAHVTQDIAVAGLEIVQMTQSPFLGGEGNIEVLAELRRAAV